MRRAIDRHVHYYVTYAVDHPQDMQWFVREWEQIGQAWAWISNRYPQSPRTLGYVLAFAPFLQRRCLWRELFNWCAYGKAIARVLQSKASESLILSYSALASRNLG